MTVADRPSARHRACGTEAIRRTLRDRCKPAEGGVLVQIEIEVLEPVKATDWID
jgi:hypothetical protein